jgi:signal transduction histidine kinase
VRKAPDDLAHACEAMVEEARAYHPDRDLKLNAESSFKAQFDRARMEQVIANLVGNAIEHGEAETPVTVSLISQGDLAVLSVHNDGPPIKECDKESLFNPMVRHNFGEGEFRAGAGLGLGLYIASAIVSAHQGSIEVDSRGGSGTTFTVKIPR